MPLHPAPTIESGLALIVQPLQRSDSPVHASITAAVSTTETPTVAVAQDIADAWYPAFHTAWFDVVDDQVTFGPTEVRLGDGSTTPLEAFFTGTLLVGDNDSDMNPPQISCLVKKTTGLSGRRNRGRYFMPYALQDTAVDENGVVSSATVSFLNGKQDTFLGALDSAGFPMVIANKILDSGPPPFVTDWLLGATVLNLRVENMVGTQRRRLARG